MGVHSYVKVYLHSKQCLLLPFSLARFSLASLSASLGCDFICFKGDLRRTPGDIGGDHAIDADEKTRKRSHGRLQSQPQ